MNRLDLFLTRLRAASFGVFAVILATVGLILTISSALTKGSHDNTFGVSMVLGIALCVLAVALFEIDRQHRKAAEFATRLNDVLQSVELDSPN
jgi:hypothetical protein